MRIKLDENLPGRAGPILTAAGYDVDSVEDEGLAGADDSTVSEAATADGRLVITMDRGVGDIQRYPPGSHGGFLVVRVDDQTAMSVADTPSRLVTSTDLTDPRECVAVYRNGDLRVRRPSEG